MKGPSFSLMLLLMMGVGLLAPTSSVHITHGTVPHGSVSLPLPQMLPILQAFETWMTGAPTSGQAATVAPGRIVLMDAGHLHAGSADNWLFVRQSVTWANANSALADNIITSLKSMGLLANAGSYSSTNVPINGVVYKVKLETGACASCIGISSTAYAGTKDFSNRFKMWRASDNLAVLELLFDDVTSAGTGDGVLLNYRLAVLSPTSSDNEGLIVETYLSGSSPSRKQTYSWGNRFWNAGPDASTSCDAGRVVLEEMTFNLATGSGGVGAIPVSGLGVRAVARSVSQTISGCSGSSVPYYYSVAYMQRTDGNFETTAREGLQANGLTGPPDGTICTYDLVKFGIFNGGGFIQDLLTLATVPTGYPDPGNGAYGVQQEYAKIGTSGAGAGGYDDLQQITIDALAPTFRSANDVP